MLDFDVKDQVKVVSEPERIGVFLTRSCVQVTDISCGVVYEATLAFLVLFRSYCYVTKCEWQQIGHNTAITYSVSLLETIYLSIWNDNKNLLLISTSHIGMQQLV